MSLPQVYVAVLSTCHCHCLCPFTDPAPASAQAPVPIPATPPPPPPTSTSAAISPSTPEGEGAALPGPALPPLQPLHPREVLGNIVGEEGRESTSKQAPAAWPRRTAIAGSQHLPSFKHGDGSQRMFGAQLLRTTRGTPRCQKYMFLHPSQSMLTELISSHLTPPHLLSSRLISPHLISSRLISPSYAPYAHSHNSPKHSRGGRRRPAWASPSTTPATPPSWSAWE